MSRTLSGLLVVMLSASLAHGHGFRGHRGWIGGYAPAIPSVSGYYDVPIVYEAPIAVSPLLPACEMPLSLPFPGLLPQTPPAVQLPAPIVTSPAITQPQPIPVKPPATRTPQPTQPGSAVPEAAPPSERGPVVPPLRQTSKKTTTAAAQTREPYFSIFPAAATGGAAKETSCTVVFWNLSQSPMTVRAGGTKQTLPRGRSLSLELPRQFVWQVNRRLPQSGHALDSGEVTILIRR